MSDTGCGCSECTSVTALQGSQGDDGTSTVVVSSGLSTTAAVHYMYTKNRTNASSDNISGAGYQWTVLTVPAISTANLLTFKLSAQVNATDVHIVTTTVLKNGVAITGGGVTLSAIQNAGTKARLSWNFEDNNASANDVYIIKFVSDTGAVTPLLTGANLQIDIWG